MRFKLFHFLGVGLALVLRQIETVGQWPQGLLDAYNSMIPEAEGDSIPIGQRHLIAFGLPFVWPIFRSGSLLGSLILFSVLVKVSLRLMLGVPLPLTFKKFSRISSF